MLPRSRIAGLYGKSMFISGDFYIFQKDKWLKYRNMDLEESTKRKQFF